MHSEYEEEHQASETVTINIYGDYLCLEHGGGPRYIYRSLSPADRPHPLVSRVVHAGKVYSLVRVEDDQE